MGHYGKFKVGILGFGLEGQDALRYFLGQGSTVTVLDKKPIEELDRTAFKDNAVTWVCGENYLKGGLKEFDIIVRSPGIYRFLPEIVEAEKAGKNITSNTKLFFLESEANIIGVTGTKGKGSTSRMLQAALDKGGLTTLLLGNIGEPMLDRIVDADSFDWVILELSSFQLIDLDVSPPIAVCTNITIDHLDWHKDREEYVGAKENLWSHQKAGDFTIFNAEDQTLQSLSHNCTGKVYWASMRTDPGKGAYVQDEKVVIEMDEKIEVGSPSDLQVLGEHNLLNSLLALSGAVAAGADPQVAWQGISEFKGYEHRLEVLGEFDGITYVNDSAATNPESTIAAIKSFDKPIVLIAGGSKKGHEFGELAKEITSSKVKAVVLIGQTAKEIENELDQASYTGDVVTITSSPEDAFEKAKKLAAQGDIVLLSPACASFGLFKNYKERGERFKLAIPQITK
ncbi:MAG: UDP-N-acetylmuramoyl-L-alanine--D-glutamate ligase [bacterium]|nr:UDP-N-acetylmuramoyl-L-alanine--D-glutamate ligase [bacterium]